MYPTLKEIHFVGIGGIGMSGLAEVLLTMGCRVTGSDLKRSPVTDRLRHHGAKVFVGHRPENVGRAQVVVTSSAIPKSNPEAAEAHKLSIPVIARAEMLAELMRLKYGIAVAGSHGKTTTTSLVASVLSSLDPTVVIGGRLKSLRSNARLGRGDYLVAEADESDGSFLHLNPTIAVVTNIDREHMDHYRDFETLRKTFEEFSLKIPFYGLAVFCADHPETLRLSSHFPKRGVTYGIREKSDYRATGIRLVGWGSEFEVKAFGKKLGSIRLKLPGLHNVLNSLAAIAVGHELGVPFGKIRQALSNFGGISRRLEVVYPSAGLRRGGMGVLGEARTPMDKRQVAVSEDRIHSVRANKKWGMGERWRSHSPIIIDDYGHHPSEIRATLAALRSFWKKRIWVLFQPHRYTRTRDLFQDFVGAFWEADRLVLTEIYPAGEDPIRGISGRRLAEAIRKKWGRRGKDLQFVPKVSEIAGLIFPKLGTNDLVLTLGAGDIWKAGRELAKKLAWIRK